MIEIINTQIITTVEGVTTRHCDIIISQNGVSYLWAVGGLPLEGDLQAILNAREAELWAAAQVNGKLLSTTEKEAKQAPAIGRNYFASHSAAVAFVRLSPSEQEAQIDAMTTAQMKTLLKYLTIAVSMLVKRELL